MDIPEASVRSMYNTADKPTHRNLESTRPAHTSQRSLRQDDTGYKSEHNLLVDKRSIAKVV